MQLPLFDMPEPEHSEPAKMVIEAHERKKPGRKPLPPELPRVEVFHDLPMEEKICACGCPLPEEKPGLPLAGNSGTGQSHIAMALLLLGCGENLRCRYVTAADMLRDLLSGLADS